jgi:hypothetical protein
MRMGLPPIARAATVTAFEEPLFKSPGERHASARVESRSEEANRLSIALVGEPGSFLLQVRDDAEPLEAGAAPWMRVSFRHGSSSRAAQATTR